MALCSVWGLTGVANAIPVQQSQVDGAERIDLRVVNASPGGLVEVDRGAVDGLELGDPVVLMPRSGRAISGVVTVLDERSALVEIDNPNADLPAGTRGQAVVPSTRFAPPPPVSPAQPKAQGKGSEDAPPPAEKPIGEAQPKLNDPVDPSAALEQSWKNLDSAYQPGMPLLSGAGVARPEQRPTRFTGRVYLSLDHILPTEDGREDAFWRLGQDSTLENPFGYGGELHLDGELNYRRTDVPDQDDQSLTRGRLDRFSYRIGGTRHRSTSYEFGRLLQRGVPEFGFLDGVEAIWRTEGGDRYGASVGFLPEPSPTLESGNDFGISGFYEWNADSSERLSATVAYQHTLHNGTSDRDLFVLRAQSLPEKGWKLFGVALIDLYTAGDAINGAGLNLTQANATARREWDDRGLAIRWTHQEFAEIDREEFLAVDPDQLLNDHYDRLALDFWYDQSEQLRWRLEGGLWVDEDEDGGYGRVAAELFDRIGKGSRIELSGFLTQGEFTDVFGARAGVGWDDPGGRWDLFYEFVHQDNVGFLDDNDDIVQHRLRVSRDWFSVRGWSLTVYADGINYGPEQALLTGVFAQKGF